MTEDAPEFGTRLRASRQSAGMSQQELAERSGLSVRAISDLERGRTRFPYQDSLGRLADALGLRGPAWTEFTAAASRRLATSGAAAVAASDGRIVLRPPEAAAIEELARMLRAQPVPDPGDLGDDIWESDAELTAFLADLRAPRPAPLG